MKDSWPNFLISLRIDITSYKAQQPGRIIFPQKDSMGHKAGGSCEHPELSELYENSSIF